MSVSERTSNCGACGFECSVSELRTVKVSAFNGTLKICKSCLKKSSAESFRDAAEIIKDINKIAKEECSSPEQRLELIKQLLGG